MTNLDFINEKPQPQRSVALKLRALILESSPMIQEKVRYQAPFFWNYSWFCYINLKKNGQTDLGFVRGTSLSNEQGLLEQKDRQTVCTLTFVSLQEVLEQEEAIREILQEAILLEEIILQQRKKR
jgi:hypothetical protein